MVPPDGAISLQLRFDPPASAAAVTPVTRLLLEFSEAVVNPRVMLFTGALTAPQLRDFGRSTVSQTLWSRAVNALVWLEPDSVLLVVAPLAPLDPGALYTLASGSPLVSFSFTVAVGGPSALARVWPDHDEAQPSARAAVWCGTSELSSLDSGATLEPALVTGRFALGTGAPIAASQCLSWFSDPPPRPSGAVALPAVSPPAVTLDDGTTVGLEPTVLYTRDALPVAASACPSPEISFGAGCADVEDDRVVVHPPEDPVLWTIDLGISPLVLASRGARDFTVRPLPAEGRFLLGTLDSSGQVMASEVAVTPAAPRAHVVLSEVMANPAGAEPAQEWVELYNDGSTAVSVGGFVLEDGSGGVSVLPDEVLFAGAFALVVADAYVADDGVDPPPAPGTVLLRVRALGRSGLSNDGERLTLRDPTGITLSIFPAIKTKNGVSVVRLSPDAPDTDLASFVASPDGSSTPGSPNLPPGRASP